MVVIRPVERIPEEDLTVEGFDVLIEDQLSGQFRTFLEAFAFAEGLLASSEGILIKMDGSIFISCSYGMPKPFPNELSYAWHSGVDYPGQGVVMGLIPLNKEA